MPTGCIGGASIVGASGIGTSVCGFPGSFTTVTGFTPPAPAISQNTLPKLKAASSG